MSAESAKEWFCSAAPCEWRTVDELPADAQSLAQCERVLLLVPATRLERPRIIEGVLMAGRLHFADLRFERDPWMPRPVAWCEFPPWPEFMPGSWRENIRESSEREGS